MEVLTNKTDTTTGTRNTTEVRPVLVETLPLRRRGGTTSETARPIDQHRNAPYPEEKEETGEESPTPRAPRERSEREKKQNSSQQGHVTSEVGVYTLWHQRERTVWMPVRTRNSALMTAILADAVKKRRLHWWHKFGARKCLWTQFSKVKGRDGYKTIFATALILFFFFVQSFS